jgi:replication-associated recombination protein RarA
MPEFDLDRMYEVISALQKEVRRGNEEDALYWALELEQIAPDKPNLLWNRLKVIATEDISIAHTFLSCLIEVLYKRYLEFRGKDESRLFLAHAILALCRAPKSRIADEFLEVVKGEMMEGKKLEIPDYALDKHTARGRAKGRGMEHFLTEGAKLVNESQEVKNPYKERAKELWLKQEQVDRT